MTGPAGAHYVWVRFIDGGCRRALLGSDVVKRDGDSVGGAEVHRHAVGDRRFVLDAAPLQVHTVSAVVVDERPTGTWYQAYVQARDRRMVDLYMRGRHFAADDEFAVGRAADHPPTVERHDQVFRDGRYVVAVIGRDVHGSPVCTPAPLVDVVAPKRVLTPQNVAEVASAMQEAAA
jgi:hypothetical protein